MAEVNILVPFDLDELADSITSNWQLGHEDIVKFILALDEGVADYDFTKTLWKKLKKLTDKEDKANKKYEKERAERGSW